MVLITVKVENRRGCKLEQLNHNLDFIPLVQSIFNSDFVSYINLHKGGSLRQVNGNYTEKELNSYFSHYIKNIKINVRRQKITVCVVLTDIAPGTEVTNMFYNNLENDLEFLPRIKNGKLITFDFYKKD